MKWGVEGQGKHEWATASVLVEGHEFSRKVFRMVFRVIRVLALMFFRIFGFALARMQGAQAGEDYVRRAFVHWAHYCLKVFEVNLIVRGREHIPDPGSRPMVILSNHQSQVDIPSLLAATNHSMGFVAKKELSRIPLLAYWMREVGCVFIDRANKSEAQRTLNEVAASMRNSRIVVFPEGTRSRSGDILPFKPGGARLAVMSKALVLPTLVQGSRNALEARGRGKPPFDVTVTFFPVLDTATLPEDRSALDKVRLYVEGCWRGQVLDDAALAAAVTSSNPSNGSP